MLSYSRSFCVIPYNFVEIIPDSCERKDYTNIKGGKTGFTSEAQHTMASYAEKDGKEYILVTAYEDDKWGSVFDAFDIYEKYLE